MGRKITVTRNPERTGFIHLQDQWKNFELSGVQAGGQGSEQGRAKARVEVWEMGAGFAL